MGTPVVSWSDKNLQDFVPGFVQAITNSGALDAMYAYTTVQKIQADLNAVKLSLDNTGQLSAALAVLTTFVNLVDGAIGDFVNSGFYFMTIPPVMGGVKSFSKVLNNALLNSMDHNRPVFSSTATIAAVGAFAFFLDNRLTDLAFQSMTKGFVTNQQVARALGVEQLTTTGGAPVPHLQNILSATAKKVVRTPWVSVNLHQLLPGVADCLLQIKAITTSLLNTATPSAVKSYLDFANRQVTSLQTTISQIQQLLDFIKHSFDFLPLRMFSVAPVVAGTADLANAIANDFFDPIKHPEVADASGSYFISGFFFVTGSDLLPSSVTAKYDILSTLFGI